MKKNKNIKSIKQNPEAFRLVGFFCEKKLKTKLKNYCATDGGGQSVSSFLRTAVVEKLKSQGVKI